MPKSQCVNIFTFWRARKTTGLVTKLILQRLYILCLHKNNKRSCCWCRQLHETDMYCLAKLFLLTEATNKNSAAAIMPANETRPAKQPILQPHFPIWRIALFSQLRQQMKMNETLLLRFHAAAALSTCIFFQLSFPGHFDFHPWSLYSDERPLSDGWPTHTAACLHAHLSLLFWIPPKPLARACSIVPICLLLTSPLMSYLSCGCHQHQQLLSAY